MYNSATLEMAAKVVRTYPDDISISMLQRHLILNYRPACDLMARLISTGVVTDHGEKAKGRRYSLNP